MVKKYWPLFVLAAFLLFFYNSDISKNDQVSVIQNAMKGVVVIDIEGTKDEEIGMGTGFFIDENLIMTNHHVASTSNKFKVYTKNSMKGWDTNLIASDPASDIAIFSLVDWENFKLENDYRILPITNKVAVGENVFAIGHPWGYDWTVSQGIVSATDRSSMIGIYVPLVQTDAKILPGNSGGPLFNERGEVVALNESLISKPEGSYGFSVSGPIMLKVWDDMLDDVKHEVRWPLIGLQLDYNDEGNVKIVGIKPDSAAEKAGLKINDVLLSFKTRLTPSAGLKAKRINDLRYRMMELKAGDTVTLEIKRGNQIKMVLVEPSTVPSSEVVSPTSKIMNLK